jgi:NAD(P)H-flavin reductase
MPKHNLVLKSNLNISEKTQFATFFCKDKVDSKPGKFFSIEVEPGQRRAYSVVECSPTSPSFFSETKLLPKTEPGTYVSFLVSCKAGGHGSKFFENSKPGIEVSAVGPAGSFGLIESDRAKIFVATGTGLAPFVGMISQVLDGDNQAEVYLFFAVWTKPDDYAKLFFEKYSDQGKYPNFKIYTVVDRFEESDLEEFVKGGRVTTVIPEMISNLPDYDYYLCGHPAMVSSMEEVLLSYEVSKDQIKKEKFG